MNRKAAASRDVATGRFMNGLEILTLSRLLLARPGEQRAGARERPPPALRRYRGAIFAGLAQGLLRPPSCALIAETCDVMARLCCTASDPQKTPHSPAALRRLWMSVAAMAASASATMIWFRPRTRSPAA